MFYSIGWIENTEKKRKQNIGEKRKDIFLVFRFQFFSILCVFIMLFWCIVSVNQKPQWRSPADEQENKLESYWHTNVTWIDEDKKQQAIFQRKYTHSTDKYVIRLCRLVSLLFFGSTSISFVFIFHYFSCSFCTRAFSFCFQPTLSASRHKIDIVFDAKCVIVDHQQCVCDTFHVDSVRFLCFRTRYQMQTRMASRWKCFAEANKSSKSAVCCICLPQQNAAVHFGSAFLFISFYFTLFFFVPSGFVTLSMHSERWVRESTRFKIRTMSDFMLEHV